jgi:hypothetical protein
VAHGIETLRPERFVDNRLTDGVDVINLTRQSPFTPRKIPGVYYFQRLSQQQGYNVAGGIRSNL